MPRERWRYDRERGELVEVPLDMERAPAPASGPTIFRPIEPYRSPVTGRVISDRGERRRDLKTHGCIDAREAPTRDECAKIRASRYEEGMRAHERYLAERFADH